MSDAEWDIVLLSLKVSLVSSLISLPFAIILGWILARYQFRFKYIVEALLQLPLVLPPVVLGYLLLTVFGTQGWIGSRLSDYGIQLAFHWQGAALAAAIVAFPLVVQPIKLAFQLLDQRTEWMAMSLGANRWQVFYSISLPLILPGIMMAIILGFSRSLGEFGATVTFAGNIPHETQTIAVAIYSLLQQPDGEPAAQRLVWFAISLSFASLLIHHAIIQRWQARSYVKIK